MVPRRPFRRSAWARKNEDILTALGYSEAEIADLKRREVI